VSARVFIFGFTPEEEKQIQDRFEQIGIPAAVRIERDQGPVVLEDIIYRDVHGEEEMELSERIVLMNDISHRGVTSLMMLFKELPVPRPIFAVVTEHSVKWPFEKLAAHLLQEKRSMQARRANATESFDGCP